MLLLVSLQELFHLLEALEVRIINKLSNRNGGNTEHNTFVELFKNLSVVGWLVNTNQFFALSYFTLTPTPPFSFPDYFLGKGGFKK